MCPNCGRDYGWLHWETGWCKLCTIHYNARKQAKTCIICDAPIFSPRRDAKFCGQCKAYKHAYHTALRAGKSTQKAISLCKEKYKEDAFNAA